MLPNLQGWRNCSEQPYTDFHRDEHGLMEQGKQNYSVLGTKQTLLLVWWHCPIRDCGRLQETVSRDGEGFTHRA